VDLVTLFLLNEEILRVGTKGLGGSHKYNVLG